MYLVHKRWSNCDYDTVIILKCDAYVCACVRPFYFLSIFNFFCVIRALSVSLLSPRAKSGERYFQSFSICSLEACTQRRTKHYVTHSLPPHNGALFSFFRWGPSFVCTCLSMCMLRVRVCGWLRMCAEESPHSNNPIRNH